MTNQKMNCTRYQMAHIVAEPETIIADIAGRRLKTTRACEVDGEPAWEFVGGPIVTSSGARLTAIKDRLLQPVQWRNA